MSDTINNTYIAEFNQYLRHLAQQEYTRLRGTIMTVSNGGETYSFDRVGPKEASLKTSRAQATPIEDYPFTRRTAIAKTYNVGELIEHEDQIQAKVDIGGGLVREMASSMARAYDDEIIRAMGADALDGDGNSVPFDTNQEIVNAGTITFDNVTEVQEKFLENDIQGEVKKYAVVGPAQIRKMLQLTEATNADFVAREALQALSQNLIVPMWMGFTWIPSTRLLANGDNVDCYFYTERAIGLAINRDITTFMQQDPSRSYAWSLYSQATYGAVRVEDEHIVKLTVANTEAG